MLFVTGIGVPEGPVVLKDGSWLVVEMSPDRGCVTHISPDGKTKRVLAKTGRPNGLAVDKKGIIWVAESQPPSLLRMTMAGKVTVVMTECNGEPFLFPNDLAFGPDGALYMTDSGIMFQDFTPGGKIRSDWRTCKIDGRVYKIDVLARKIEKLDSGIRFTNGIAFGPDGNLYVNETLTGNVYRYQWKDGKISGGRELFGNVNDPQGPDILKGPDGMKFGADGNLYVTVFAQGDVTVLGPNGKVVKRLKTAGKLPTNLAFGLPGDKRIYVTEDDNGVLEALEVGCGGFTLYH